VGDFNRDGIPDLAVVNSSPSNLVTVLLGNANGTIRSAVSYQVGTRPSSVVVGDFNRDGRLDLAVSNAGDNTVSVLLGTGDGNFFLPAITSASGLAQPGALAVEDFDQDGQLDLAVVNQGNNTVSVLLGNGDGTFQVAGNYPTGLGTDAVAVGDFNRDGNIDLAVGNGLGTVNILLGNGDGTFRSTVNIATGLTAQSVAVGDFNGDGIPDLALSGFAGSPPNLSGGVSVLLGKGDGTFQAASSYNVGQTASSLAVGDFNGDGHSDLAIADQTGFVWVLLGNGDGTFRYPPVPYAAGRTLTSLTVGDFNRDGLPDIAATDLVDASVNILLNGAGSHTVVAPPGNASVFGQPVTFTATVTAALAGAGTPSGSVTFFDGATVLGSATLDAGGHARLTTAALVRGDHAITAVYSGDANFIRSAAAAVVQQIADQPVADVTALVAVSTGALHHHRRHAWQTVTLTNQGGRALEGPLTLVLARLGKGVRLVNLSGRTHIHTPTGSPFEDVLAGGVFEPGATVTVMLLFQVSPGSRPHYLLRVLTGVGAR
jgi:hypothetical protein